VPTLTSHPRPPPAARLQLRSAGARPGPQIGLAGLPPEVVERARWWEDHIIEVVDGTRPDMPAGTPPRPEYDVERTSLREREQAKAAELSASGRPVSASTVKHRRQRWQAEGLPGLVDRRVTQRRSPAGRADPAVAGAMEQAIAEATDDSSRTATFIVWRTRQILAERGQAGTEPSRATMFRLFSRLSAGRHTTGSAVTRRGLAGRPQRMFSQAHPAAPGELMEIDSTPLDIMVLLDDGVPGRVQLTGIIDVATRTASAAVLRPSTRSVDASVLLARALTPEPMRPGWPESLTMAHSALPYDRLLSIDERLRHAAARPVIVPDTIVIDHGAVFVSDNFRSSCRHLGISIQPAHLATGSDKPHIEKMFSTLGTQFCQFAAGYLGRSADRRGRRVEGQPLWSLMQMQDLLDEWLISAEQGARRAAGPAAPAADVLAEPEVRRADRDGRVRAGPAQRRGPYRAAARGLAGRQRLRHQDQPPDLRRCRAEPDQAAEVRRHCPEGTVGGPPRPV